MSSVSQILEAMGRSAGLHELNRGAILAQTVSGLGRLPGQILDDRAAQRAQDYAAARQRTQDEREDTTYAMRLRGERTAQKKDEVLRASIAEGFGDDPDPAHFSVERAGQFAITNGFPELVTTISDIHTKLNPPPVEFDPAKGTMNPRTGEVVRQPRAPGPKTELDYAALTLNPNPVVSSFAKGTLEAMRKPAAAKSYQHVDRLLDGKPTTLLLDPAPGGKVYDLNQREITDAATRVRPIPPASIQINNDRAKGAPGDFTKSGDDFLATIPAQWRRTVKTLARYDADPTKVASMRGGMRETLMHWILQVNPGYKADEFAVRAPTRKAFTIGPQGQTLNALNTAIGHLDQFSGLADELKNFAFTPGNKVWNELASMFGAAAVSNFDTLKDALAGEVAKTMSGGQATVSGMQEQRALMNAYKSPAQLAGYVKTLIPVMGSKLSNLNYQYHQAMGDDDSFDALSPESRRILEKHGVDPDHPTVVPGAPAALPNPLNLLPPKKKGEVSAAPGAYADPQRLARDAVFGDLPAVAPTPDRIATAASHATGISATPLDRATQAPYAADPSMRARTHVEAVGDTLRTAYQFFADSLPGKVTDAVGLSAFAETASDRPRPATMGDAAGVPAVPGRAFKELAGVFQEVARLFPRLDNYGKATGRLTAKTITARLEAASGLSTEAQAVVADVARLVGDRRVSAQEVLALAQGQTYTPDRIVRKLAAPREGAKQRPGAPLGVTNARQEAAARERYMQRMVEGVEGRDWYIDAGGAIRFYANDDPARAMTLAEDIAATSSTTTVSANTGFGTKGYNQATAGVPVETGRFPTAMGKTVENIHTEGTRGLEGRLKQSPFAYNMAEAGGFLPPNVTAARPTNDIWQGEAFGFMHPDGSPMRAGFTAAQHRWMDEQTEKILIEANRRGLGGHTNWDVRRAQAAAWVAAKVRAGEIKPADAARSYAAYFADLAAQGSRETVPGITTAHLRELHEPGSDPYRQILHEMVNRDSGIYDAAGRDQIAAGYGGLVGSSFEGPGVFQGQPAPGRQTQVLTGSLEVPGSKGARVLDAGSRRILDASEATYGLLTGQDASAYSRVLPAGSGQARNAWDVTLPGGTVTPKQMQAALTHLGPAARDMVLIPTPDGIRLAFMDDATAKQLTKALGGKVKSAGTFQSNLIENNWQTHPVGQNYFDAIRTIGTEKFDAFAPKMAARLRDIDARFAKETGGRFTLSPVLGEVRAAIAADGFAGLERLAKKFAIPVALLATGLAELRARTSASRSTRTADAQ